MKKCVSYSAVTFAIFYLTTPPKQQQQQQNMQLE